jgi:mannosylglycerate hydrolase
VSLGCPARIWLEENGPLAATVGIEVVMVLPAFARRPENYVRGESCRSEETRELVITSWITLKKGSRRLEVKTRVENTVCDHRLRLMLPCGVKAGFADAAGHFTVDHRPVTPTQDASGTTYPEMQTLPMQSFVDISDGQNGLAVLNNCFTEYQAIDGEQTTLAITLFRAMRNIICTEFRSAGVFPDQHGGQLQRTLQYNYALYPHRGDWHDAELFREAQSFNTPPTTVQTCPHKLGHLPPRASLFAVESDALVVSTLKRAEDRETLILRLHNPTGAPATGTVRMAQTIKSAWQTSLNEERRQTLALAPDNTMHVAAGPNKIVTLELEFA